MEYGIFFEGKRVETQAVNDIECPSEAHFVERMRESFQALRARRRANDNSLEPKAA